MVWHPILATDERTPGTWILTDTTGVEYGQVSFIRRGDDLGYRATLLSLHDRPAAHAGYFKTLMAATMAVHRAFIAEHAGPRGPAAYGSVR